jgi:hypothetical protein
MVMRLFVRGISTGDDGKRGSRRIERWGSGSRAVSIVSVPHLAAFFARGNVAQTAKICVKGTR